MKVTDNNKKGIKQRWKDPVAGWQQFTSQSSCTPIQMFKNISFYNQINETITKLYLTLHRFVISYSVDCSSTPLCIHTNQDPQENIKCMPKFKWVIRQLKNGFNLLYKEELFT